MKRYVLALPFLILSGAAAWADDACFPLRMSLDEEPRDRQDVEMDRQRPDERASLTPMEFVYRHSELEAGAMYTNFDGKLGLRSHLGFYLRYGVEVAPHLSVHLTYRHHDFGSGPSSPAGREDVRLQAFLLGASYHLPLTREFAVVGGLGLGPTLLDSTAVSSETAFTISGEIGVTASLWQLLRLKTGLVLDGVNTDFHSASGLSVNLSWLFGVEIGL